MSAGSVVALAVMTLISVGIGAAFSKVPDALKSSLPVGEILGVALLVFFGFKALKVGTHVAFSGSQLMYTYPHVSPVYSLPHECPASWACISEPDDFIELGLQYTGSKPSGISEMGNLNMTAAVP